MKIILIHGNAQEAILKKVSQIKKGFNLLSITEGIDANFNFASLSLFSEERLVILENPDIKLVEQAIGQGDSSLTILFVFSKALEKSSQILKKVTEGRGEVLSFDEANETSIFPFLDMLGNRNQKAFVEFEKNYSQFGGQYILTMLAYFLRRMVAKPKTSSDFMKQKIENQKRNFSFVKIRQLYKEIIETDFKIKQGLIEEKLGVTLLIRKMLN